MKPVNPEHEKRRLRHLRALEQKREWRKANPEKVAEYNRRAREKREEFRLGRAKIAGGSKAYLYMSEKKAAGVERDYTTKYNTYSIMIPHGLADEVRLMAKDRALSFSAAAVRLIHLGLGDAARKRAGTREPRKKGS